MSQHRIVVIGGGVRSGKSSFAVKLGQRLGVRRAFVATATASDPEMRARIDQHRRDRQEAYDTVEEPFALVDTLSRLSGYDVVVIDCLTLWLSNRLVRGETVEGILEEVDRVVLTLAERRFHAVLVTNEVGMSVHPPTPLGRAFVELCGFAHQRLARSADEMYLAILGTMLRIFPRVEAARIDDQGGP